MNNNSPTFGCEHTALQYVILKTVQFIQHVICKLLHSSL